MNTKEGETNIQSRTNRTKKDSKKNTKRPKPESTNTDNH